CSARVLESRASASRTVRKPWASIRWWTTPAFTAQLPGAGRVDREGFKALVSAFATGFPDATQTVEAIGRGLRMGRRPPDLARQARGCFPGSISPLFDSITLMTAIGAATVAST